MTDPAATDRNPARPRPPGDVGAPGEAVSTGHPAVDAAVRALAAAADRPLTDQIAEYEAAHRTLQETLASIDEA